MKRCRWHSGHGMDDKAVLVAAVPRTSGPDVPVYACTDCVARLGLVPLSDRADGTDTRPVLIGRQDAAPILPDGSR